MEGIFVPLAFFALVFGSLYIYYTTRNKERLALIEKGASPELFKSKANPNSGHTILKIGMFLIGVAIGILAGYMLSEAGVQEVSAYFSMIFLFGGLALVITFFVQKKIPKN